MINAKKHHTIHMTILELINMLNSNDINLNPVYQRHFVTDEFKQKGILNCIKSGKYLPQILLRPVNNKFEVLDGKQRITTIKNEYFKLKEEGTLEEFDSFKCINLEFVSLPIMTDEEAFALFLTINETSVLIKTSEKILGYKHEPLYLILKSASENWMLNFFHPKAKDMSYNRYKVHDSMVRTLSTKEAKVLLNIKNSYLNFKELIQNKNYNKEEIISYFKKIKKTVNYNLEYYKLLKIKNNPLQILLLSSAQVNTNRHNPPDIKVFFNKNIKYFNNNIFQKEELELGLKSSGGEQVNKEEYNYFYKKCLEIEPNKRTFSLEIKKELKLKKCKCKECGTRVGLEVDHIIPFSKGGATNKKNAQLLCSTCNKQKSNSETLNVLMLEKL